jgi:hypothetical protein
VDYADLDGFLLISSDPFSGVKLKQGKIVLPDGRGLVLNRARLIQIMQLDLHNSLSRIDGLWAKTHLISRLSSFICSA